MKPVFPILPEEMVNKFNLKPVIYAKDQPQYLQLPAVRSEDGLVISEWKLSMIERIKILLTGTLFLEILTFNTPLQPIKLTTGKITLI